MRATRSRAAGICNSDPARSLHFGGPSTSASTLFDVVAAHVGRSRRYDCDDEFGWRLWALIPWEGRLRWWRLGHNLSFESVHDVFADDNTGVHPNILHPSGWFAPVTQILNWRECMTTAALAGSPRPPRATSANKENKAAARNSRITDLSHFTRDVAGPETVLKAVSRLPSIHLAAVSTTIWAIGVGTKMEMNSPTVATSWIVPAAGARIVH